MPRRNRPLPRPKRASPVRRDAQARAVVRKPSPGPRRPRGMALPARPRKSLGQHFLRDELVLDRIVRESGVQPGGTVLEIGPGTGELTERLLDLSGRVVAVEIDETLCAHLRRRFAGRDNLAIVCAPVLDHTPSELLEEGDARRPYDIVANIPYYITAPILRQFLETHEQPRTMTVMVQREVAESLVAPPGKLSLAGVSVQFYAEARLLFVVPPSAFEPPPKVDSAVVRLDIRPRPAVDVPDVDAFFEVVRAGFANPRKQLRNALPARMWLPPDSAAALLESAGIDPTRRAQTLSLEEWVAVDRAVRALRTRVGAPPPTTPHHALDGWDTP
jgi:16S rRNA (adenine1518-N6/adenine1519-N6)-dimethyltransferase